MKKIKKWAVVFACILLVITGLTFPIAAAEPDVKLDLSEEEQAFISRTQDKEPLVIGIIPQTFPLSDWPAGTDKHAGIILELLHGISELSGLRFEYYRLPVEEETPYQVMQGGKVTLVAGTIKLDSFLQNPNLILSDRLSDGSAVCIAKQGTNPSVNADGTVAVLTGYQAGFEFARELFPTYDVKPYSENGEVLRAVRRGDADMAIISRYVGIYQMQSPLNENLVELSMYNMEKDNCVMGINTPENQVAISIINKALAAIGEDGYNHIQMNFSLTHPYKLTFFELLYKYRHILLVTVAALIGFFILIARLRDTQREHKQLSFDSLTGALTEAGFELMATNILSKSSKSFFITDFDVYLFSSYNELNGKAEGDALLKTIVSTVKRLLGGNGIICRSYADHFRVLSGRESFDALMANLHVVTERVNAAAKSTVVLNFGVYPVADKTLPISKMLDFASMAKKHVKHDSSTFIGVFDDALLEHYINDAKLIAGFEDAIAHQEFVVCYQPKFDAVNRSVIGAEALVRWAAEDGSLIPPLRFIELFEKSGQIQRLDFYVLEQVCIFLSGLDAQGVSPIPVAVNFSKVHLYNSGFVNEVNRIVERYGVSRHLIEIECTETVMTNNIDLTRRVFSSLREQGFSIAMDDFGSAYSSLNALYSIPLDVLKLDRGFLMATLSHEKAKSNIIVSSAITLAHDLSLKVVGEGVETEEQYQFLRSLGCDFIQGFYFSKPLSEPHFLELLSHQ